MMKHDVDEQGEKRKLERKAASGIILTLLLIGMLTLAFKPVKADETIYIRPDGSVSPSTALIQRNGDIYTLTGNIRETICVERSNIIIDGNQLVVESSEYGWGIGIRLWASNVTIRDVRIRGFEFGMELYYASAVILRNVSLDGNMFGGLGVMGYYLQHFIHDIDASNTVNGKPIYYMVNQENLVISPDSFPDVGYLAVVNSTNISIRDLNIEGNAQGLLFAFTNNSSIKNVTISNGGLVGIEFLSSPNNTILNSEVTNNREFGIICSENSTVSNNNVSFNGWGVSASGYSTIRDNNISYNFLEGIDLYGRNSLVAGNYIANNGFGISARGSENSTIKDNEIEYNFIGIELWYASNNWIYHNNFISNELQIEHWYPEAFPNVFDTNKAPYEGNYWSDYEGVDDGSGVGRFGESRLAGDGIGDTDVPHLGVDWYPLMNPWTPTQPVVSATTDIAPDTLNLRSEGKWITAYIQLLEGYNPANISAAAVSLNETVSPVLDPKYGFVTNSSEYLVDHNNDGILERMVKFDRTTVESWIFHIQGIRYGNVALTISGTLNDGTPFTGTDIIFVNYAGDVNNDGFINSLDIGKINAHWSPSGGAPTWSLGYSPDIDTNNDSYINSLDIGIVNLNWGQQIPSAP